METGIVTETKHGKTRTAKIKTSVFATSNNTKKVIVPLQSRFFPIKLEPYIHTSNSLKFQCYCLCIRKLKKKLLKPRLMQYGTK
jgi:hypothetical protein